MPQPQPSATEPGATTEFYLCAALPIRSLISRHGCLSSVNRETGHITGSGSLFRQGRTSADLSRPSISESRLERSRETDFRPEK